MYKKLHPATIPALFVAVFLIAALAGGVYAQDFGWIVAKRLTVSNAADLQSTVAIGSAATLDSTLDVDGATTLNSTLDVDGTLTQADGDTIVADDLRITAQTGITVTDTATFTPTGSYQPIGAAGTVTPVLSTGAASAGDILTLINTTAQTINLADSGNIVLSAAAALGQYDVLILWFDGTRWIEISRSDN